MFGRRGWRGLAGVLRSCGFWVRFGVRGSISDEPVSQKTELFFEATKRMVEKPLQAIVPDGNRFARCESIFAVKVATSKKGGLSRYTTTVTMPAIVEVFHQLIVDSSYIA